jgi:hypothetical protein
MSRALAVCNLRHQRLADAWPEYENTRYLSFRSLCRDVWREVAATESALPFFDWHELIVARSRGGL